MMVQLILSYPPLVTCYQGFTIVGPFPDTVVSLVAALGLGARPTYLLLRNDCQCSQADILSMMMTLHPHIRHENDTPNWCTYLVVEYVTMATSYGNSVKHH